MADPQNIATLPERLIAASLAFSTTFDLLLAADGAIKVGDAEAAHRALDLAEKTIRDAQATIGRFKETPKEEEGV